MRKVRGGNFQERLLQETNRQDGRGPWSRRRAGRCRRRLSLPHVSMLASSPGCTSNQMNIMKRHNRGAIGSNGNAASTSETLM